MEQPIRHLPRDITKYTGAICQRPRKAGVAYQVNIRTTEIQFAETVPTRAEAEVLLREKNEEFGLPVKNVIWEYADHLEVELTQGKKMKCNKEDRELVESHVWCVHRNSYACTTIGSRKVMFHNLKLNHQPGELTVDHLDQDGLDNRSDNLRIVDKRTQSINQGLKKTNKSGIVGIHQEYGLWIAQWRDAAGRKIRKTFSINKYGEDEAKQMAINHRHEMIFNLLHYREALQLE